MTSRLAYRFAVRDSHPVRNTRGLLDSLSAPALNETPFIPITNRNFRTSEPPLAARAALPGNYLETTFGNRSNMKLSPKRFALVTMLILRPLLATGAEGRTFTNTVAQSR